MRGFGNRFDDLWWSAYRAEMSPNTDHGADPLSAGSITGVQRKSYPLIEARSITGKQVKIFSLIAK
jgi:hypothetical protein